MIFFVPILIKYKTQKAVQSDYKTTSPKGGPIRGPLCVHRFLVYHLPEENLNEQSTPVMIFVRFSRILLTILRQSILRCEEKLHHLKHLRMKISLFILSLIVDQFTVSLALIHLVVNFLLSNHPIATFALLIHLNDLIAAFRL